MAVAMVEMELRVPMKASSPTPVPVTYRPTMYRETKKPSATKKTWMVSGMSFFHQPASTFSVGSSACLASALFLAGFMLGRKTMSMTRMGIEM